MSYSTSLAVRRRIVPIGSLRPASSPLLLLRYHHWHSLLHVQAYTLAITPHALGRNPSRLLGGVQGHSCTTSPAVA